MEFESLDEIRLLVDGRESTPLSPSSSSLCLCRICHEEEEQGSTEMENPCACSGTLKFAHRGCIQRWCDEKGSTVCEICLKKFEPGYTVTVPSARMIDVVITIRGSLEAAHLNNEPQSPTMLLITGDRQVPEHEVCSSRGKSCLQSVALVFTTMILLRHPFLALFVDTDHYADTFSIGFLRTLSILLPSYVIVHLISVIGKAKRRRQLHGSEYPSYESEDDNEELQQHLQQHRAI